MLSSPGILEKVAAAWFSSGYKAGETEEERFQRGVELRRVPARDKPSDSRPAVTTIMYVYNHDSQLGGAVVLSYIQKR